MLYLDIKSVKIVDDSFTPKGSCNNYKVVVSRNIILYLRNVYFADI